MAAAGQGGRGPGSRAVGGPFDVVVIGSGNAALCAALAASATSNVLVLEKAPIGLRGGNTRFTGAGLRVAFGDRDGVRSLVGDLSEFESSALDGIAYSADDFYEDIMAVTGGRSDECLARVLAGSSYATLSWLRAKGAEFQLRMSLGIDPAMRQGAKVDRRGLVVSGRGGGEGWSDGLYRLVEKNGVTIRYDAAAEGLIADGSGRVAGIRVRTSAGVDELRVGAVVLACGGFEASDAMRSEHLGPSWNTVNVRGTRFNTGDGLRMALEIGAQKAGAWDDCHATPVDFAAPLRGPVRPSPDDVAVTHRSSRTSYYLGILVNDRGERFVDEGEDIWVRTYAKIGRAVLAQPNSVAFEIFDQRTMRYLQPRYEWGTRFDATSIDELAVGIATFPRRDDPALADVLSLPTAERNFRLGTLQANALATQDVNDRVEEVTAALQRTVGDYNKACSTREFEPFAPDGHGTRSLTPAKSNWAVPLEAAPFVCYPVRCGITFTYGGVKIDADARVLDASGRPIAGLYAAGEMVGGLFYDNYPGGAGLMAGAVFGRIAGVNAAREAHRLPV